MTFSKKYSTTLTEMSREIKQKFQGLSEQKLSAMLIPIRAWFHLGHDEAALMLALMIHHKSSKKHEYLATDKLHRHFDISEEWKPKLLKGLYYLIEKGISFPCIYSGNLERFYILLSDKVLNSIRTQSCYTPDDAHKHDRISAIFYFYSQYHAWRSELFINESTFNLEEELYDLMRFLDPERRRGLCELSVENQLILICLFVHRFSGNEPLPFPDFLKLVCLSEERERQLRYDIESEVNFLVASSIFYIEDPFMDEMYVFTNLDRLRKLVLGDMPNPDVGIRPVIHPLHWVDLSGETETLYFPADFNRKLSDFLNNLKKLLPQYSSDTNNFIYKSAKFIYGARGMGKSALVYRIARELGGDVYRYDFNDVVIQALSDYKMNNHLREFQRFVEKAKQLCKNGSIVILDNFIDPERLLNSQNLPFSEIYALTQLLEKLLKEPTGIIFVISRQPLSPKSSLMYYFDEIVHVPDSTKDSRKDFWSMLIPEAPTVHLDELKNHTMSFYEIKMLCERNRNPDGMISSTALIQSLANQKNDLDVKEGFVNIFSSIETTPLTPLEFPTQSEMESELDKEHEIEKMNAENTDISNEVNGRRDYPTAYPKGDYEPF